MRVSPEEYDQCKKWCKESLERYELQNDEERDLYDIQMVVVTAGLGEDLPASAYGGGVSGLNGVCCMFAVRYVTRVAFCAYNALVGDLKES